MSVSQQRFELVALSSLILHSGHFTLRVKYSDADEENEETCTKMTDKLLFGEFSQNFVARTQAVWQREGQTFLHKVHIYLIRLMF